MKKSTLLLWLLVFTGGCHVAQAQLTWPFAKNPVTTGDTFQAGDIIVMECRANDGGAGYFFRGATQKNSTLSKANNVFFVLEASGDDSYPFRVKSLKDGNYIKKTTSNTTISMTESSSEAAMFSLVIAPSNYSITNSMAGTVIANAVRFITSTGSGTTFLNNAVTANTPMYATGTADRSVWYVYRFTEAEVNQVLENPSTLTYRFLDTDGTTVLGTNNSNYKAYDGMSFPQADKEVSAAEFFTVPEGTFNSANGTSYDVTLNTAALPFRVSTITDGAFDAGNTHWYVLTIRPYNPNEPNNVLKTLTYRSASEPVSDVRGVTFFDPTQAFAFTGNAYDGFKIYNYKAGATNPLTTASDGAGNTTFASGDGTTYGLCHHNTDGHQFQVAGNDSRHLHDLNDQLSVWNHANSPTDAGSAILFTEIPADRNLGALGLPAGFYRFQGKADSNKNNLCSTATLNGDSATPMSTTSETGAGTVFYLDESGKLLNYGNGLATYQTHSTARVNDTPDTWTINHDLLTDYYEMKSDYSSPYLYNNGSTFNRYGNHNGDNTLWTVEEVTALPVTFHTVGTKGYATVYSPVALTIPEGVKAYTGSLSGTTLTLTALTETIPANTAVVLTTAADVTTTLSLPIDNAYTATFEGTNDFRGATAAAAKSSTTVLTLQNPASGTGVGFYNYTGANVPAFRAYMEYTDGTGENGVKGFALVFEEATAIADAKAADENGEVRIYDLTGRRLTRPVRGMNIINGKKIILTK